MVLESFPDQIEFLGVKFRSVKIFHPRKGSFGVFLIRARCNDILSTECLGVTYLADPVCDDVHATLPLEVHIITFTSSYYASSQGKYISLFTRCFNNVLPLRTQEIEASRG